MRTTLLQAFTPFHSNEFLLEFLHLLVGELGCVTLILGLLNVSLKCLVRIASYRAATFPTGARLSFALGATSSAPLCLFSAMLAHKIAPSECLQTIADCLL